MSAIFNHAIKFYGLQVNPAAKAGSMGEKEAQEMLFWTKDEFLKFIDVMMDTPIHYYAFEIEMVYQEQNMILESSVAENLFVGNLPGKGGVVDFSELYKQTNEILQRMGLNISAKAKVKTLNSGQMQFLSIMRAYVKKPKILVLDEPTTALSDDNVELLMEIIKNLRDEGISCIYISHRIDELFQICDRLLVMRDGQVISCRPIDQVNRDQMIEEMVGRKVENLYPKEEHEIGEEALRVEHLTVQHPKLKDKILVNNISFSVHRGEILGIGGLVGAGRSEVLGAIFGQYTHGVTKEVYMNGKPVTIRNPKDAIKAGIGFITEERKESGLVPQLSIRRNIALASLSELSGKILMNDKKEFEQSKELSAKLRIKAPNLETKVQQLSGGNQQKVILAKWLLKNPQVLFVDEPTKGIDVGTKADFYTIMNDLAKQGIAIVMVSSDMPELIAMSDRCLVLANGRITKELKKGEINEINVMKAAVAR